MQDQFGNYVLKMNSIGQYYPREDDGGGTGVQEVFSGDGLAPDVTPEGDNAIWIDKNTGIIIHWYDGAWQI